MRPRSTILAGGLLLLALLFSLRCWTPTATDPVRTQCLPPPEQGAQPEQVWIPGGHYTAGSDRYPEELPLRQRTVAGFWMDRTEVTNAAFAEFVQATRYVSAAERTAEPGAVVFHPPAEQEDLSSLTAWWRFVPGASWRHPEGPDSSLKDRDHLPVVNLSYEDAMAYARWRGRTLPTEAQWEWAARAGLQAVDEKRPPSGANIWQGVFPRINTAEDGFPGLAPVGCFPPNAFGLYDMLGNVWELTSSPFEGHSPPAQVIKGGSYLCAPNHCQRYRPAARQAQETTLGSSHVGFRTVLVTSEAEVQ